MHIDSTGSLVKKLHWIKKPVYYYVGVVRHPNGQSPAAPLFEYLSSDHTAPSIGMVIDVFLHRYKIVHKVHPDIFEVVVDFSFAMLNAVCSAFNVMTLSRYLQVVWEAMQSGTAENAAKFTQ